MFTNGQLVQWRNKRNPYAMNEGKFIGLSVADQSMAIIEVNVVGSLHSVPVQSLQSLESVKEQNNQDKLRNVPISLPTGNMFLSCLGTCGANGEFVSLLPKYVVNNVGDEVQRISAQRGNTCTLTTVAKVNREQPDHNNIAFEIADLLNQCKKT